MVGEGREPSVEHRGLTPPFPEAEPGVGGGRKGILILSSLAGRVMSPPTRLRGEGEWVAHGERGGAGRNGGGASPPPTQGPGTHLFHLLGREGTGSEVDPDRTQLTSPTHQRAPKAAARGLAGGRACPPTLRGTGPPGTEHRGLRG